MSKKSLLTLLRSPRGSEVFMLGTAHISEASEEAVRRVIQAVKPKTVVVELCAERAQILRERGSNEGPERVFPHFDDPLMSKLSSTVSKFAFANGRDMHAAILAADDCRAKVVYGDLTQTEVMSGLREAFQTIGGFPGLMARAAQAPPPPPSLLEVQMEAVLSLDVNKMVENIKDRSIIYDLKSWVGCITPELMAALLDRRDDHIFQALKKTVDGSPENRSSGHQTVAVVGVAHMDGIEEKWRSSYGSSSVLSIPELP